MRPSLPKYTVTWDVKIVLNYLEKIPTLAANLQDITMKFTMLLALLSGQRLQTLHALKLENVKLENERLTIFINSLLKQSRPTQHLSALSFRKFDVNDNLCIVLLAKEYIRRTQELRIEPDGGLLISYIRPHKPVSKDTLARWIKNVITKAGVDVSTFSAHSTRAASTSAMFNAGVPVDRILQVAGWSNATTFERYYHRGLKTDHGYKRPIICH